MTKKTHAEVDKYFILVKSEKTGRSYILDGRGSSYEYCHDWISKYSRKGFVYGVYPKSTLVSMDKVPSVKFFKEEF